MRMLTSFSNVPMNLSNQEINMEINKPKIGEPCNGCGICCMFQTCRNGAYVLGLVNQFGEYAEGRCPALVQKPDKTYACGIILNPNKYIKNKQYTAKTKSFHFARLIGAGNGCDELLPNDTLEEEQKLEDLIRKMQEDPTFLEKIQRSMTVIHGI